jgi:Uma2 family endonuclease
MAAHTAISLEQYLHTSFPNPDPEFRDGEIVERSMPDYLHGQVQGLLFMFFALLRNRLRVFPSVETRLKMGPNKVLIPDVTVFYPERPKQQPDSPPFIAIEVLSVDDRLSAVREKLEEYRAWGVPHVWLVDPHSQRLYTCHSGLTEVPTLQIPELDIELKPTDVFDWQ